TGRGPDLGRVVEWGSGGGANAVHFAPRATEFVSVDVSTENLDECARQTAAVCDTPVVSVRIDVGDPEAALDTIGTGSVDTFLCVYVIELLPSPAYVERILAITRDLLTDDGVAFLQFRYQTRRWSSRATRRNYRRNLALTTVFPIDEFWEATRRAGLEPEALHLVPKTALDERYGYLVCTRAGGH
ncbi:MAG: class I SAM-dependent methyltransferase, partial [Gordonia sp. (in: high G+C Gram-positive bacteria)]